MSKHFMGWFVLLVLGSWLVAGCVITPPLIREPSRAAAPITIPVVATPAAAPPVEEALAGTKVYRLLAGESQVRFIAREHCHGGVNKTGSSGI